MKNWKLAVSSLALAGVLVFPAVTMAYGGGEGHHKRAYEHIARELQLTEGQKAQLKANRDGTREARKAQREQMNELRKQIHTAIESGADQAAVDQLGAELGKLKVQQMQNHYQMRQQFEEILTEEQKAKFEELKAERKEHRMKWRKDRLERGSSES